tara:strand:+ start:5673 stop:9668 length:3996 start_codon:yes stop_codon:yes gene_type:complete
MKLSEIKKSVADGAGVTGQTLIYDSAVSTGSNTYLPTGLYGDSVEGTYAFTTNQDRLYLHTGQGWFQVSTINTNPTFTTGLNASYDLAKDATAYKNGTATNIEVLATDPEGFDVTYTATGDTAFNNIAHIDRDPNHDSDKGRFFVIEPKSQDSVGEVAPADGVLTITASDGINTASTTGTFSLVFDLTIAGSEGTTFLSKGIGTGGDNSSFSDKSTTGTTHTITAVGNTDQGTFSPYSPARYSWFFDAANSNAVRTDTNGPALGTGDLTVEFWFQNEYDFGDNTFRSIVSDNLYSNAGGWTIGQYNNQIRLAVSGSSIIYATYAPWTSAHTGWNHVAWVRNSGTSKIYINGHESGSVSDTTNYTNNRIIIGASSYQSYPNLEFTGWIHDLRIVVGTPVYTGDFTPPDGPLTTTGGSYPSTTNVNTSITASHTKYQACNLPYIYGKGSTGNAVQTPNNTVVTDAFSPYKVQEAYSSSTHGGSAYMAGPGYGLTVPTSADFDMGTGNYTIEMWVYPTTNTQDVLLDPRSANPQKVPNIWWDGPNSRFYAHINGNYINGTVGTCKKQQWYHVALTRNSTNTILFVNGRQHATTFSDSFDYVQGTTVRIGKHNSSTSYDFKGYISDFRWIKGDSRYPFLPVAETITTTTSYENGITVDAGDVELIMAHASGFTDGSDNGHSLTNNGAAIESSTIPAVGMKSIAFADGDYVDVAASSTFAPGTGDFTIEFWFKASGNANDGSKNQRIWMFDGPSGNTAGANQFQLSIAPASNPQGAVPGSIQYIRHGSGSNTNHYRSNTINICDNAWHHVAIVRKNGVVSSFVDGRLDTQTSNYSGINISPNSGSPRPRIGSYDASSGGLTGYISNMRYSSIAVYSQDFTPPTSALTEVSNTKLLLSMTDGKIIDEGGRQHMTLIGDTQSHSGQPRVSGLSGILFDGNGDYINMNNKLSWLMRSNEDYTLEFYTYYNATPAKTGSINPIFYNAFNYYGSEGGNGKYDELVINTTNSNRLYYYHSDDTPGNADTELFNSQSVSNTGSFIHVALVKRDQRIQTFVDGNPGTVLSVAHTESFGESGTRFRLGSFANAAGFINAYISEFRITRGQGRYPFLPKKETLTTTTSFQDGVTTTASNVKILGAHTSTLTTNSGNSGTAFSAESGVSASTFGPRGGMVSALFDESSNAMMIHAAATGFGTGVFTVELWMSSDSTASGAQPLVGFVPVADRNTTSAYRSITFDSGQIKFVNQSSDVVASGSSTVVHSKWYHVAVTRESDNKIRIYLNGTFMAESSGTYTENFSSFDRVYLGRRGGDYFKGYMSNVRMTSQVLYTKNFTPPATEITG